MDSFRRFVRSHELFIALSLVLVANALFVGGIHSGILPHKLYYFGRFLLLGSVLGTVVLIGSGFSGVFALLRPLLRWRISPWWYLLAFTWAASMCTLTLIDKITFTGAPLSILKPDLSVIFPVIPHTGGVGTFVAYGIVYYTAVVLLYLRFGPKPILPSREREAEITPDGLPQ